MVRPGTEEEKAIRMNAKQQTEMQRVIASAPGTLMLMGEHAVLRGSEALACAVDKRIRVDVQRRTDGLLRVESALGIYENTPDQFAPPSSLRFAGALMLNHGRAVRGGFSVNIHADFSSTVGLGSSSAVTVALTAALRRLRGLDTSPGAVFDEAFGVIRNVQGSGSGTDVAACLLGGVTHYRMTPRLMETLPLDLPLLLVYCGYKTPTPEVIRRVDEARMADSARFDGLDKAIRGCVEAGWNALRQDDLKTFGEWMNKHQEFQEALGVSTPELDEIIICMRLLPGVLGAKISGSGLGDCALALGPAEWPLSNYEAIPVRVSREGLKVDYDE